MSSACFYPEIETENCIPLMKKYGFDIGEIFLNTPSEYEYDFLQIINERKLENNFRINSVHAFCAIFEPFLFDRYERRRKDMFYYFRSVCKACKQLDAEFYTFHGMRKLEYENSDKKFIVEIYNQLTYIAAEEGIKLAQENVSWCMSSNLDYLSMVKENCKYPLYFTFDIKQAYKASIEPEKYINIMGKDLVNLHVNDRDIDHVCMLPGVGEVDYYAISKALNNVGYKGNAIIEVYRENFNSIKEVIKSKKLLASIL